MPNYSIIVVLYLGNEMKHEAEICYVEVTYGADFGYGIEIRVICQNRSELMAPSFSRQCIELKFGS